MAQSTHGQVAVVVLDWDGGAETLEALRSAQANDCAPPLLRAVSCSSPRGEQPAGARARCRRAADARDARRVEARLIGRLQHVRAAPASAAWAVLVTTAGSASKFWPKRTPGQVWGQFFSATGRNEGKKGPEGQGP